MTISLSGKRVLVTGATGAIGGAIAQAICESDGQVYASYFRDEEGARRLESRCARVFQADLTRRSEARALVLKVLQEAGSLDALVYTAGNARDHTLGKMTDEEWDSVLKLHLEGLAFCAQAILPSMRERKSGKLVAMGSLSGVIGRLGSANYAAAKAGVVGFMKSVAKEAGRFGVSANVILPGFIDSKMTRAAAPEAWDRAKADSALGTISSAGTAASFTVWLLSDMCQGVTGQVFHLDSRVV